jgi:lipopolysaccharide/colanic/teichoic acid biosynthesis glycosyltransferase
MKCVFDIIFATVLLAVSAPAIGVLVLLVRLTSRGPGIFKQIRVGLNGKPYEMYKIRTMTIDAEKSGFAWCTPRDNRITRIGAVLRALHLDELPQLYNVARGEMSLVGPRPERPEFVTLLTPIVPDYQHRLAVRPGITGLAQVNLPPDTDGHSVHRKQVVDLQYVARCSVWLDLRILAATGLRLFGLKGGMGVWVLGLREKAELPATVKNFKVINQEVVWVGSEPEQEADVDSLVEELSPAALSDTVVDFQLTDTIAFGEGIDSGELTGVLARTTNVCSAGCSPKSEIANPGKPR